MWQSEAIILPLSGKVKVLYFIRKEKKSHAEVAMVYAKNESSIHENVKKGKEIHARFTGTPQTAKVMATVRDKCLVKTKNALNLYDKSKIWVMAQKREGMSLVHKPSGCAVPTWAEGGHRSFLRAFPVPAFVLKGLGLLFMTA